MAVKNSFDNKILVDTYGKWLWLMRRQPWHAAYWLTGIFLPPHERLWLGIYFGDSKENNVLASRGTSKSFTHASFAGPLKAVLYKDIANLTLSASGFRGGKELFKDAERLIRGKLRSQIPPGNFLLASVDRAAGVISKDPSLWTIPFRSNSRVSTAPTNNPDQLRGLRATEVQLDERAFIEDEIPKKIIRPMLNVGSDFRKTASGADKNKMYQISTIDYSIRGWWNELQVATRLQQDEFAANKARKAGDWKEHDRLMDENESQLRTASFSYTRVDYTDLLIPETITSFDGEHRYKVNYPLDPGIKREDILKYDEQDGVAYFYTYPLDKKSLEEGLRNGTIDEDIWLAEQRNVPISASGNVFDHELIQRIAERAVPISTKVRRTRDADEDADTEEEFFAPVMFTCGDPCVLGVDVARESDETAFVIIRLGELAEEEFSPFVYKEDSRGRWVLGETSWNHICWAESHPKLEAGVVAEKIRELRERYNIISTATLGGVAMDLKGGGSAVRDELGNPKPPIIDGLPDPQWNGNEVVKLYDPEDEKGFGHYGAMDNAEMYWGGLRLITARNEDNREWTFGAKALMQQKKLYLAYWLPPSKWAFEHGILNPMGEPDRLDPEFLKWDVGYQGIRRLKNQLLRIQTKITEAAAVMSFVMPGDRTKDEGKKDLWAAMIYAISLARQHLLERTRESTSAPMVAPIVVNLGSFQAPRLPHRLR